MSETEQVVTCGGCGRKWVPNFSDDCYEIDGVKLCESCGMPYMTKSRHPEPVDNKRATNICKKGQGAATCAFLCMAPPSFSFACAKYSNIEDVIRERLQESSMRASSDNCSGPPAFKVLNS